jgi:CDP-paratose 2-epimerase
MPPLFAPVRGAGFIGTNLAHRLLSQGREVRVLDNLSRAGVAGNLAWLRARHGARLEHVRGDIRDPRLVAESLTGVSEIFHFAAQVAVTGSLDDPLEDFQINAGGTLNLLEAIRQGGTPSTLIFTSTNKVYGHLNDVPLTTLGHRYAPRAELERDGFGENRPLEFHSPYGCSKGAADQYVLDYARTFGLRAVVFRMSCIYGPHQCGNKDQGWVANFLSSALAGEPITLYGDGCQVRDLLHVDDLVDALLAAQSNIAAVSGRAFNIGGGPERAISLLEFIALIKDLRGATPVVRFSARRIADQRYYVSDTRSFGRATGWKPKVGVHEGLMRLYRWLEESRLTGPGAPGSGAESTECPADLAVFDTRFV